jgi:serine/threonine-protein kinase
LDAAHASGVVHRDVKPANVIVAADPADSCYVTDFGLSKRIAQDSVALTAADSYVGSFHYVAPEAFNGGECDHRADVYSLGCVLCECLTGAPPFPATREIEVLYAHLKSPPPLLSTLRPDLPAALDEVLATAMAKDPADRYASCLAIVHAARMAIGDEFGQAQAGHDDAPEAVELRFEVISGNLTGTVIEVGDELHIGRAADGHGQLGRDPEISRFHARIAREADGTYAIEDLGSTNGTFVNGLRISSPCILRVGDTLEVGGTTLLAAAAAAAATTAPAGPTPEPPADAGPPPGAPPDVGPTPHAGFPAAHSSVRRVPSALAPAPAPSPPAPEPPLPSELPSTEATPAAVRIDRGAVPPPLSLSLAVDFERADVHLTLGPGMPALHLGFRDGGWQVLDPD